MKDRSIIASVVMITCLLISSSQAQVAQLGRLPTTGKVKPTGLLYELFGHGKSSTSCDGGCDAGCDTGPACGVPDPACGAPEPLCGLAQPASCGAPAPTCGMADPTCGIAAPDCGAASPSCGLVGRLLGSGCTSCGLPEPSCGATGLGYSGSFGLCGGSCDSCGVGGYIGRNIHKVNPCACGGSLIADMARGFLTMVDRAVGTVVGGVFGGLQTASCHASGTFATLQCAAISGCDSCGGGGCTDCAAAPTCGMADPTCGVAAPGCGCPTCGVAAPGDYSTTISSPTPTYAPAAPTPIETAPMQPMPVESAPIETAPIKAAPSDPFLDDPSPLSQRTARPRTTAKGYRVYQNGNSRVAAASYQKQVAKPQSVETASAESAPVRPRYLRTHTGRAATFRR